MKTRQHVTKRAPHMRTMSICAAVVAILLSVVALAMVYEVFKASERLQHAHKQYEQCSEAANDMLVASDHLTSQARMYVKTGDAQYLDDYLHELFVANRRNLAVETLQEQLKGTDAYLMLYEANNLSNELARRELYAMRLTADALGARMPEELLRMQLTPDDAAFAPNEKQALAESMLFGDEYKRDKRQIVEKGHECTRELMETLQKEERASGEALNVLLGQLRAIIVLLASIVLMAVCLSIYYMVLPMRDYAEHIKRGEPLHPTGAVELRYVANAYNAMYDENRQKTEALKHEAEHDALTGLYNRRTYDRLLAQTPGNIALLLIDVDLFKQVNDQYGHDGGDAVLKWVAQVLRRSFGPDDFACRIGGDEFSVIMTNAEPGLRENIATRLAGIARELRVAPEGLPQVTLSIGVAFSQQAADREGLYKAADEALYEVKERGRNGFGFYHQP